MDSTLTSIHNHQELASPFLLPFHTINPNSKLPSTTADPKQSIGPTAILHYLQGRRRDRGGGLWRRSRARSSPSEGSGTFRNVLEWRDQARTERKEVGLGLEKDRFRSRSFFLFLLFFLFVPSFLDRDRETMMMIRNKPHPSPVLFLDVCVCVRIYLISFTLFFFSSVVSSHTRQRQWKTSSRQWPYFLLFMFLFLLYCEFPGMPH